MTREEAYLKLANSGCETRYGLKGQGDIIFALEILGLLKFDEPQFNAETIIIKCFESVSASNPSTRAKELVNWLSRCGYEITRKY